MTRQLLRRLLALLPVALGVATLTFALIHLVPGDPVSAMLGDYAAPADVARMRHDLKLDLPLWKQYAHFIFGLAHGDLGQSISQHAHRTTSRNDGLSRREKPVRSPVEAEILRRFQ